MKINSSIVSLPSNKRDITLDILKGIGIILVVLGHIYSGFGKSIIYLFHMPLFFFASGAVLSYSDKVSSLQLGKKAKRLLIPYFFFSLLSFVYWWLVELPFRPSKSGYGIFHGILGQMPSSLQQFINIFICVGGGNSFVYNTVLWFLPCMFCCVLIYTSLRRLKKYYTIAMVLFLSSIYWILRDWGIEILPFCIGLSFLYLPFFWLGENIYSLYLRAEQNGQHSKIYTVIAFIAIFVIADILCGDLIKYKMNGHSYGVWWSFYLIATSIIILVLFICYLINKIKGGFCLSWLGENSLVIMCLHGPIYRAVLKLTSVLTGVDISLIRHSLLYALALTALTITITIPIIIFINKKTPFVLGKY